ncbi:MAG: trigger factor [Magnetococcus sp. YQC-5]
MITHQGRIASRSDEAYFQHHHNRTNHIGDFMEVTVETTGTFDRTVTIRIEAAQVNQMLDKELKNLAETVKLPGFRPGKIPKPFLESRFRDHLISTVTENLMKSSYPKALQDHDLHPADQPELQLGELIRNQDFVYHATMQIIPEVKPQDYSGMALTRHVAQVTDPDVDKAVETIREQHARFEPSTDQKAALGDQIVMDFKGFVDNEPFEGGAAEAYVLELGAGRFIDGFEDQLIGIQAGEERDIHVTFPANYAANHLAGKNALFQCKVAKVRTKVLPPVDDALAQLVNIQEGGLEKLRADLHDSLLIEAEKATQKNLRKQIYNHIMAANPLELPEQLIAREQHSLVEQAKNEYKSQGLDPTQAGYTDEVLAATLRDSAIKRVSLGLLLGSIASQEKLEVTPEMMATQINEIATSYGPQAQNFKKWLQNDPTRLESIRSNLLEDVVIAWVIQNGIITEQSCSLEELIGDKV